MLYFKNSGYHLIGITHMKALQAYVVKRRLWCRVNLWSSEVQNQKFTNYGVITPSQGGKVAILREVATLQQQKWHFQDSASTMKRRSSHLLGATSAIWRVLEDHTPHYSLLCYSERLPEAILCKVWELLAYMINTVITCTDLESEFHQKSVCLGPNSHA